MQFLNVCPLIQQFNIIKMPNNTIEIQIFVSCPSDVSKEKEVVVRVCERVNTNLIQSGCDIRVKFRDFSEIIGPAGERPQQIINERIIGYDIYLGILHMRFGTPTGASNTETGKPFESGTEEEFEIASNKKLEGKEPIEIYLFFKKQTGSEKLKDHDQAGKVLAFKERLMPNNWVNNFDTTTDFDERVMDLLTQITQRMCIDKKIGSKQEIINEISLKKITAPTAEELLNFVPDFVKVKRYIHRSVSQPQKEEPLHLRIFSTEASEKPKLKELITQEKRIVLLGNAGSGKSVELQQTAKYFLNPSTPFISIYRRFNTYTNEDFSDFLPKGWNKVDPNVLLLLLDGLDEIQPQHFNTAVRKLIDFSDQNPNIRIVISSRTNFYELPYGSFSGTLTGFTPFILNDISIAEIKSYTESIPELDWDKFINDIYNHSYLDLIQKPFFLDILINFYIKHENFIDGRLKIIEESLLSMIDLDIEHFKSSRDIPRSKNSILTLLERVAFVMEVMGKNFITDDELEKILPGKVEFEQIKCFSAFSKNPKTGYWMFEHNNIQEFLASRILGKQTFDKLIKIISFPPLHNKLKPTWVNTLSFFISTSEKEIGSQLIDWLIDKDVEVIVKFEPNRIDDEIRIQIFKSIFNFYKGKGIWISSNKFNNKELAGFAEFPEILDFLVDEIRNTDNSRIVRLNAISLIDNFNLERFDSKFKEIIRDVLITTLEDDDADTYQIHQVLYALANLKINDRETIDHFVSKYSKRLNQYVRAGLYKLINSSTFLDEFADLFLEGLNVAEIEDAIADRESINLMDESWQIQEGISKMKSEPALKKIFSSLKNREDRRRINRYDNKEIVESILKNAFESYDAHETLYNDIYDVFIAAGREYDREYALLISEFFEKSNTRWKTFLKVWNDENVKDYDRTFLLELLFTKEIMNLFLDSYSKRDFTNQDVEEIYEILIRNLSPGQPNYELLQLFEDEIKTLSGPILQRPQYTDWTEVNKKKAQKSFDLLFNKNEMLEEIESIFKEVGKEELKSDDLWEFRKGNYIEIDDYFIPAALDLLRDFTSGNRNARIHDVAAWMTDDGLFEYYQVNEIYQAIHGSQKQWIIVSPEQLQFIKDWCYRVSNSLEIDKAITSTGNSTSVNWKASRLWFFINRFDIVLPKDKMLGYTLFYDFEYQNSKGSSSTIERLEKYLDDKIIESKVVDNLSKGINEYHVWSGNASYAISKGIKSSFTYILRDLKNSNIREHLRGEILELYYKETEDNDSLHAILEEIGEDEFRWKVIDVLIKNPKSKEFLSGYLNKIISTEFESHNSKLSAARFLTHLNDISGFKYISKYILESGDPNIDYSFRLGSSAALTDPKIIPILFDLLKLAKRPEFKKDRFNNLESYVLDALYYIGIQSEENFVQVKTATDHFIKKYSEEIEHLNFLHFNIRKIEDQFYLKKSQEYSVDDALREYNTLYH